jgi:hypothetical protein
MGRMYRLHQGKKCVEDEDGKPRKITLFGDMGMDSKAQIKWILKKSLVNI